MPGCQLTRRATERLALFARRARRTVAEARPACCRMGQRAGPLVDLGWRPGQRRARGGARRGRTRAWSTSWSATTTGTSSCVVTPPPGRCATRWGRRAKRFGDDLARHAGAGQRRGAQAAEVRRAPPARARSGDASARAADPTGSGAVAASAVVASSQG